MIFFFFQAEDGIRDYKVTGVQTCALPISFEAQKHGEHVSQDGSTACRQLPITACRPEQVPGDKHRQGSLPHVADQRDDTGDLAGHPEHVGKSDVATAGFAWVDPSQHASREDANRNGSEEIADHERRDRKSTRLNSSHLVISYAVFCLKKKKKREPECIGSTFCMFSP